MNYSERSPKCHQWLTSLPLLFLLINCSVPKQSGHDMSKKRTDAFLEHLLQQYPSFGSILSNRDDFRVQVIYTKIDRKKNNKPVFTDYYFNVDAANYFYPASTVKMPVALLALQKLRKLRDKKIDRNTSMITEEGNAPQTAVYNDPLASDGRPTVAQYTKKIFLVSDNDAYNRLYEFCGRDYINKQLHKKGFSSAEILHRLSSLFTPEENRYTNPVSFFADSGKLMYRQPQQLSTVQKSARSEAVGRGYMKDDILIEKPFDFSSKNRISLEDLHMIMRSIIFPDAVPKKKRFKIRKSDYEFVRKYMSQYPAETSFPPYNRDEYWDFYTKFLLAGAEKTSPPKNIRIFNKAGDAYGFLTDVAYIIDTEKQVEFMLSATIYCNSDGIINDDKYDYEQVGFPFMKQLGEVIYDFEINRPRKRLPDLKEFVFSYDK